MIEAALFLAAPFAACVVLVAILSYLGLHVLLRKVIFVDLALAQIAALGTLVAFLFHYEPHTPIAFLFSFGAALLGAAIFSFTRDDHGHVPQEAIIGITYVIASALGIVVADRAPEGAEHIKEMLAGGILWVTPATVLRVLAACAFAGALHWIFRRHFVRISEDPDRAREKGDSLAVWDFFFYAIFGLVVTVAVEIAGVLMVFAFLVAPAIIALSASRSWLTRILLAWGVGLLASVGGLAASYRWDLPSGPAIVCSLGVLLVLARLSRSVLGREGAASSHPVTTGSRSTEGDTAADLGG